MVALTIGLNLLGKGGMAQPATFIFVGVVLCFISAVLWQKHDAKKKAKQELLNLAAAESLKDSASPETISSDESAITTDTAESKDLAENNQSNND